MALVTHGTTLAGFKAIMAGKGKSLEHNPWTVSDNDGQMYFYDVESVGRDYGHDYVEEQTEAINATANQSFEAARLQYAAKGQGGLIVVLVCDIPDDMLELDYSCHGDSDAMPNARAVPCDDFNPEWIVDIQVADFDVWDCVAVLSCVWANDMFNRDEVPERLSKIVESCLGADALYDCLYDFELESVNVEEFIQQNA